MDSFEFNKVIGAFLGVLFVAFSISLVSDALFAAHAPEKPGYAIEAAEAPAGGGAAAPAAREPIAVLLASASPEKGADVFKKCGACHTGEKGGANKVGPNLFGVIERPIASHEGFAYSGAIKAYAADGNKKWTYEEISAFLVAPKAHIPGTAMAFAGIKDPKQEADLIAYLRTLSDSPVPLPAAPAAGAAAAPAGGTAPQAANGAQPAAPAANGAQPAAPAANAPAPAGGNAAAPATGGAPVSGGGQTAPGGGQTAPAQNN